MFETIYLLIYLVFITHFQYGNASKALNRDDYSVQQDIQNFLVASCVCNGYDRQELWEGYEGTDNTCVFPFIFKGETYHMCTRAGGRTKFWCGYQPSLTRDFGQSSFDNEFGWCYDNCPFYGRGKF